MYTFRLRMKKHNMSTRIDIRASSGEEAVRKLDPHWDDWAVMEIRRIK